MMTSYDLSLRQTDVAVNEIVKRISVPLADSEHILIRTMQERQAFRLTAESEEEGVAQTREWLRVGAFAAAPLTTRRGPLGVIVADNAISGNEITDLDLEFLQLFANESANAIENSRLYHELERRLVDLRKVTQRQKADQETLLRMERLSVMGETSAIVAHELRNPLVAIGGFARTLLRSLPEGDPNRRFATIITEEVGRLERIIHDLLDFIRPQKLLRKSVLMDELMEETVRRFEDRFQEQEVDLELDLRAPGLRCNVNPGEIQQVLQNLLVNALQVLESGGAIIVRSHRLEGGLRIEVLDDGPGFAPDLRERMFTPFFTTKASGSGLGLTICSQIVKAHGGMLDVRPRERGGACFFFILPLPRPAAADE
jgi:signal transduction histidine kinase